MDLLLDVGNTRLKWGLHDGQAWQAQGALALTELDGWPAVVAGFPPLARVLGANVAGPDVAARLASALALRVDWLRPVDAACGVSNQYLNPARLGADRWAALIGARALHAGASLVVTSGTATTVDVLDAEGVFRGGLILPGMSLMRQSLARNTAQLPPDEGRFATWPRQTEDAILSGCIHAQVGAIERMFRQLDGLPEPLCLLNGGAAPALLPHLGCPLRVVDNLVLEGLVRVLAADTFPASAGID